MNRWSERDDSYQDRLSSFLKQKAGMKVVSIYPIKENVYQIKTANGKVYILKGNNSLSVVVQQWRFFKQLNESKHINKFVPFPHGEEWMVWDEKVWTIAPFINGETLHFSSEVDRQQALETVKLFHGLAEGTKIKQPILRHPLYVKWTKRITKLKYTESTMRKSGFSTLYLDLLSTTESRLSHFENFHWFDLEHNAMRNWTWIHGDVASHNFIRDRDGAVHLIDFDLLSLSPLLYDHIQLGQRFLPFIQWDIDQLLGYCSLTNKQDINLWLYGITIPSDLIREWWTFLQKKPSMEKIFYYLDNLSNNWEKRRRFVEAVDRMLL
ncbi:phosphotransferase [Aquibacillus salsiterrae]|uniref:Phosphotransferase n=1 Tax=Aquibacillus salsiterrae TaxID=2950439 RepID=A0A9X3WCU3_9BACI|nr:phosphotransferase [Aquibacillus salsiterrae]MDC3415650.1 phosphotransferase [Aquibacillus salsiterrae]